MKNNRKILLINPKFQWRFIFATLILVVFSMACFYVTLQYIVVELIEIGIAKGYNHDSEYFQIINQQKSFLTQFILAIGFVLTVGSGFWALYFSHRIAGPMYKLHKIFSDANQSGASKIAAVRFRKNDFFHEVTDQLNSYLDKNQLIQKDD